MRQLSALDRMFLTQETPRTPMHISMLLFYTQQTAPGGLVRFRDILESFRSRAPEVPFMHERVQEVPLGLDNPWWVEDPEFNVESHVHHIALPKPGDWRQLCILAARLHARGLDRSRPLWEAYVIEGLDGVEDLPRGSFAVMLKMHHAAVDGHAALHGIETLHDESARPRRGARARVVAGEPGPGTAQMLARAAVNIAGLPGRWVRLVRDVVPAVGRVRALLKEGRPDFPSELSNLRFNRKISSYRVVGATFLYLDDIKKVREAVEGATVNDIVVSVIGGAMRKYLLARGELPVQSPVTIAPLSFRDASEREFGGNLVSAMAFPIHTDIEDPVERLQAVRAASAGAKDMAKALGPRTAMDLFEAVPPQIASMGFLGLGTGLLTSTGMATPVNTVITNVAGPGKTLYLAGARMVGICGFGPIMDSMGLFHAVMSYDGTISIAINSCREIMPDPAFYMDCVRSAWDELQAAAAKQGRRRKPVVAERAKPPRKRTATAARKAR